MATKQIVHMNPGQGETSYARNSTIRKTAQDRMKPLIDEAVTALCGAFVHPKSIAIADLGCSSGPNALVLISATVNAIHRYCKERVRTPPEMCVFLNDLPSNDFNTVAKSLAEFKHSLHHVSSRHVVVANMAPEELAKRKIPINDFTLFLSLRAQELVIGGRLIFSLIGRCSSNPASVSTQEWKVGVISKEKFDTFHIPIYAPLKNEVNGIIEDEGSFQINKAVAHDTFLATDGDQLASPSWCIYCTYHLARPN
uniref:Jasmonate O-methyltransferase n=1 Tax=Oryza punctata TaxID=4537 RepID=A0A0E0LAZ5_ORYPU